MLTGVILIAALIIAVYVVVSFSSALRMRFVYGTYAHIEYNRAKWSRFGKWAPRRLIFLLRLRRLAMLAIVIAVVSAALPSFLSGASPSSVDASAK